MLLNNVKKNPSSEDYRIVLDVLKGQEEVKDTTVFEAFQKGKKYGEIWDLSRYPSQNSMYRMHPIVGDAFNSGLASLSSVNGQSYDDFSSYTKDGGLPAFERFYNSEVAKLSEKDRKRVLTFSEMKNEISKQYNKDTQEIAELFENGTWYQSAFGMVGEMWGSLNPTRFASDLTALTIAARTGGAIGASVGGLPGGFIGAAAGTLGSLLLEGAAIAGSELAINYEIVNRRREELGLPLVDLAESSKEAAKWTIAFGGAGLAAKSLYRKFKPKPIETQTVDERVVSQIADSITYRDRSPNTDAELAKSAMAGKKLKDIPLDTFTETAMDTEGRLEDAKAQQEYLKHQYDDPEFANKERSNLFKESDQVDDLTTQKEMLFPSNPKQLKQLRAMRSSEFLDKNIANLNKAEVLRDQFFAEDIKLLRTIIKSNKNLTLERFIRAVYEEDVSPAYRDLVMEHNLRNKAFVDWANARGIDVGYLDNRIPQSWDKTSILKSSPKEFIEVMNSRLDWDKIIYLEASRRTAGKAESEIIKIISDVMQKFAPENRAKILKDIRQAIVTDGLSKIDITKESRKRGSKYSRLSKNRFLYFKDADGFLDANNRYGRYKDLEGILYADAKRVSGLKAQYEILGRDAQDYLSRTRDLHEYLSGGKMSSTDKFKLKQIEDMAKYIAGGYQFYADTRFDNAVRSATNIKISSMLAGIAPTAAIGDFITTVIRGSKTGLGFVESISGYVNGLAKLSLDNQTLEILRISLEADRWTTRELIGTANWTDQLSHFSNKVSGLNYITSRGGAAYSNMWLGELSKLLKEEIDSLGLGGRFGQMLKSYGINEKDVRVFRENAKTVEIAPGVKVVDLGSLYNKSTYQTWKKFSIALGSEVNLAISKTRLSYKVVGSHSALMNGLFFLGRLPLQVAVDHGLKPFMSGEFGYFAQFFVTSMMGGAMLYTLKSLIAGKSVDPKNPDFWKESFLRSEMAGPLSGIFGNDVFSSLGRSVFGPFSSDAQLVATFAKQASDNSKAARSAKARKSLNALKSWTPFYTHPAARLLFDRFFFDNLQLALDPLAKQHWAEQEHEMRKKGVSYLPMRGR